MRAHDDVVRFNYDKRSLLHFFRRRIQAALGHASPLLAYLKITRRCNLDCEYCPWHTTATDFAGERSTTEWQTIITRLAHEGVRIFVFEGGEPTLRADLPQLLAHVNEQGGYSILATNGTTAPWRFTPSAFTV